MAWLSVRDCIMSIASLGPVSRRPTSSTFALGDLHKIRRIRVTGHVGVQGKATCNCGTECAEVYMGISELVAKP